MLSRLKRTAALAAILLAAGVGAAHATEGWYGRVDAGYSVDGQIEAAGSSVDLDDDWMAGIGAGYAFMNGVRVEGEISYRNNELPIPGADATAWVAMINAYYDFNRGGGWEPYVGAGVGWGNAEIDAGASVDDDSWAWQAMAGVAFPLSERLDLDVGYRFFRLEDLEFSGTDVEYEHQAVTVGLRYQFGAAAPPPPPPPPPAPPPAPPPPMAAVTCPTSEFVVYFEWDRSNLNQAALETIDAAVARARECNVSNVVVVGHTDTSGSTDYNQGLSERRASVVRDALVARGIDSGSISTQARGESDLARATADGVREPLNRRTAVTISFR